jgi:hypothetical protein
MIIINIIRGGLGNQLFQWALTRQFEEKYNCEVLMDISNLNGTAGITDRYFELSQFPNLKYKILNQEGFSRYVQKPTKEFHEGTFNFNNYSLDLSDDMNYSFLGYWQNFNFINNISEIVKKELSCPYEKIEEFYSKYPALNSNTVSIHIRRTDYLTSNGFHPVQPISYYEKALEIIGEHDNVFIFSDDIQWCKDNLHFKNQTFIHGQTSSEDIWLMSLCKHNIIANSSFSWWGAWLNQNKDKKVIQPYHWFSTGHVPSLSPSDWIII